VAFRRSTTTWTPKTIPFGFLIALLGGWVIAAALVGPLFNFGFFNDTTWQFSAKQWETQLIPGIVAVVGGLMLMTPSRGGGALGALLAFAAGAWLIVCPILCPLWSSGTIQPYGSQGMQALRWIGHFYGPGALIIYFAGYALGLFSRRTVVQDTQGLRAADAADRFAGDLARLRQQRLEVERRVVHRDLPVLGARPLLTWAVAVELDPISIRVAQVDRLADSVIGCTTDRDARIPEAAERIAQRRSIRIADRNVVEARRPRWRRGAAAALPGVDAEMMVIAAGAEERRLVADAQDEVEPEHVAVEAERPVDVRDFQMDVPDVDARIDRRGHACEA
jgi:hypothetical protein